MKAFILSVIAALCASTGVRGGVEIEHLTDTRARGIVKVWWDEVARKQFLERLSLGESNFVAVCVGDTKLVCSMPAGCADDASARSRIDVMRRHHDMDREMRQHDFERDDDSKWLTEEVSNAFNRAQCERDALVRLADEGSQKSAKEWSDLRRKEESARLERLLDRFSRNEDAMIRGKGENIRRAWEESYAEMRKRGVSAATIEHMRHERELRDAHHREFMPHERMDRNRMLREEVREFERWLEMRVSEDRRGAQRDLKKSVLKRQNTVHNQESRILNGKEMAAQIAKEDEKKQKMLGSHTSIAGVGIIVLVSIIGTLTVLRKNKGNCNNPKNDAKCDLLDHDFRFVDSCLGKCVFCGERQSMTMRKIYQSMIRKVDDADDDRVKWIYRCGFSVPMCNACLWKYRGCILGSYVITLAICAGGLLMCSRYWMWACETGEGTGKVILALLLLSLAIGVPALFYLAMRMAVANVFLFRIERSNCSVYSNLLAKGYEIDGLTWPRCVRKNDTVNKQKQRTGTIKGHSYTERTVYEWLGDFDLEGLQFRNAHSVNVGETKWQCNEGDVKKDNVGETKWQCNEGDVKKDEGIRHSSSLEDAPNGVSVSVLKDVSGYRIVYSRRRIRRILLGFLWLLASGLFLVYSCNSISHLKALHVCFSGLFFVCGCSYLFRELFGKDILELKPKGGSYTEEGRILWGRWEDFPLSALTRIHYRKRRGYKEIEYRDIVIKNKGLEEIALGSSLPEEVQDYFVLCMSSWTRGRPLTVSRGRTWHANIAHPFLFAIFALATAFCLFYALSCQERVLVRHGKICISETDILGRCKTVAEVPIRDVEYLHVHEWKGRRGTAGRSLHIIGHDLEVITEITGLDIKAEEYERGMEMALKGTGGVMFDRKRNNAGWSWLFVCLLWFVTILFCGDGENRPKKGRMKK